MAKTTRQTAVKITRELLTKAIVYNCPRYTRNGGVGVPPHACADLDGGFTNCPGVAGLCSQVGDIFKTMVRIKELERIISEHREAETPDPWDVKPTRADCERLMKQFDIFTKNTAE